jgi:hypothetical protein
MGFMVILATTIVNVEEVLVDRVAVGPADPDESERQSMLNEYSGSQSAVSARCLRGAWRLG